MWIFFDRFVASDLFYSWEHQNFCHNALYQNFCPGGLWHFGPYLAKFPNCRSNFGHFFMPMPCFLIPSFSATLASQAALNGCSPRSIGVKVPL